MADTNKKVVGSYATTDEALEVVNRLSNEGFLKHNIILYSNKETASMLNHQNVVEVVPDNNDTTLSEKTTEDKKRSIWNKIKNKFTLDTYDYHKKSKREEYDQETDILYKYRKDIAKGNIVVTINDYRSRPIEEVATAGNTSEMPSDVGHSVDPGNTSEMPSDIGPSANPENDPLLKPKKLRRKEKKTAGYKK